MSVSTGVFPERWKQANIIPLYKKSDKKDPADYRSVSLLPIFGSILERVVYDELFRHVKSVLSQHQHGFIPGRSCVTNLSIYLKYAWEAISDDYQTDAIYTDYSAAFQSVNHALLIHKLRNSYHLKELALDWFVSYLSDRRQRVIVNGKAPFGNLRCSGRFTFGPPFFDVHQRPIEQHCVRLPSVRRRCQNFCKITSPTDGLSLQRDLSQLCAWSARWGLTLNPAKCKSFTMTLRRAPVQTTYFIAGTELDHESEIRDLGITLDTKLTFASHVSGAVSKANRAIGLLIRSFQTGASRSKFSRSAVLAAYFANVRSILEYCSVVWAEAANTHTVRVDRVQHKFLIWLLTRTDSGHSQSLSYSDLLHQPPGRGPPSSGGGCGLRGRRRRLHTDAGNQTDLYKPLPRLDAAPRRAGRAPSLTAPLDIWGASVVWAANNVLRARVPRLEPFMEWVTRMDMDMEWISSGYGYFFVKSFGVEWIMG